MNRFWPEHYHWHARRISYRHHSVTHAMWLILATARNICTCPSNETGEKNGVTSSSSSSSSSSTAALW